MSDGDKGAGEALGEAAMAALDGMDGLNRAYEGPPLSAAFPYALAETGPESDWSHKSGDGRELRLAVTIRDRGERPQRLRALMRVAEAAVGAIGGVDGGWRLVNLVFLRSRIVREPGGWAGVIEWRARMLRE